VKVFVALEPGSLALDMPAIQYNLTASMLSLKSSV
jgi:hypothetical protein